MDKNDFKSFVHAYGAFFGRKMHGEAYWLSEIGNDYFTLANAIEILQEMSYKDALKVGEFLYAYRARFKEVKQLNFVYCSCCEGHGYLIAVVDGNNMFAKDRIVTAPGLYSSEIPCFQADCGWGRLREEQNGYEFNSRLNFEKFSFGCGIFGRQAAEEFIIKCGKA